MAVLMALLVVLWMVVSATNIGFSSKGLIEKNYLPLRLMNRIM